MRIILVRHGDYDGSSGFLNDLGKKQVEESLQKIRTISLEGKKALLFTSPLRRAQQSADIIGSELGLIRTTLWWLSCDGVSGTEIKTLFKDLINKFSDQEIDDLVLILVSHQPNLENISEILGSKKSLRKGEVFSLDNQVLK